MKIIVSSNFSHCARRPGALDNRMAYVRGLMALGHDVYVVEDVAPERCFDDGYETVSFEEWTGRVRFQSIVDTLGLGSRSALIYDRGRATHGLSIDAVERHARSADLLVSVASALDTESVRDAIPCRVYVDTAPAKVQVYHDQYGIDYGFGHYHHFFTFGLNIGSDGCPIPTCGVEWHGSLPPVVMSEWPRVPPRKRGRFTTVSSWAGSKHTFDYAGVYSGDKADEWRRFAQLPRATDQTLEIALNIHPAYAEDIELLEGNGWVLRPAGELDSVGAYREYLVGSRAELSISNARYVRFNTGFFGDRTARYLACGRPALVQRTGFEGHLPVGEGLLTFETIEEARAGIDEINGRYELHADAARSIAEEHFAAERVLSSMLAKVGCP
jgi:hypothetical protein